MRHKKYSIKGRNIQSIINAIKKEIDPCLEEVSKTGKTFFYVFEEYSFLQNSDMSGILLIEIIGENDCIINLVVAGGKTGLLQLDIFGREKSVLKIIEDKLQKICNDNNWQMV